MNKKFQSPWKLKKKSTTSLKSFGSNSESLSPSNSPKVASESLPNGNPTFTPLVMKTFEEPFRLDNSLGVSLFSEGEMEQLLSPLSDSGQQSLNGHVSDYDDRLVADRESVKHADYGSMLEELENLSETIKKKQSYYDHPGESFSPDATKFNNSNNTVFPPLQSVEPVDDTQTAMPDSLYEIKSNEAKGEVEVVEDNEGALEVNLTNNSEMATFAVRDEEMTEETESDSDTIKAKIIPNSVPVMKSSVVESPGPSNSEPSIASNEFLQADPSTSHQQNDQATNSKSLLVSDQFVDEPTKLKDSRIESERVSADSPSERSQRIISDVPLGVQLKLRNMKVEKQTSDKGTSPSTSENSTRIIIGKTGSAVFFEINADTLVENILNSIEDKSEDDALFELDVLEGLERPLRLWESLFEVVSAWKKYNLRNLLMVKPYDKYKSLSPKSLTGYLPRCQGWLHFETKPEAWIQRFSVIRDGSIFYYESSESTTPIYLCSLQGFEIYSPLDTYSELTARKSKIPTPNVFALRSIDPAMQFENKDSYVRFFAVEKENRLENWVDALRITKNEKDFQETPFKFTKYANILAPNVLKIIFPGIVSDQKSRRSVENFKENTNKSSNNHERDGSTSTSASFGDQQSTVSNRSRSSEKRKRNSHPVKTKSLRGKSSAGELKNRRRSEEVSQESKREAERGRYKDHASGSSDYDHKKKHSHRSKSRSKSTEQPVPKNIFGTPLVDISDTRNCRTCGCSDFRALKSSNRKNVCGNCLHPHK